MRKRNLRKKDWIQKAIKRPGALHRTLKRWYGLPMGKKIPDTMLEKASRKAKGMRKSPMRTRTIRQINLARNLKKITRKRMAKRRRPVRLVRRKAANPSRGKRAGTWKKLVKKHGVKKAAKMYRKRSRAT